MDGQVYSDFALVVMMVGEPALTVGWDGWTGRFIQILRWSRSWSVALTNECG